MTGAEFRYFAANHCDEIFKKWPGSKPSTRKECPVHGATIGPVSRMCLECHTAAWAEVGLAFAPVAARKRAKLRLVPSADE